LTAPPDTAEPTKVKALNLPDEPDDEVDGAPTVNGDEPEEVEGINDGGEGSDDAKSDAKPCQASSSSRWKEDGGREDMLKKTREKSGTNRLKGYLCVQPLTLALAPRSSQY
jgi:hypothetical protein